MGAREPWRPRRFVLPVRWRGPPSGPPATAMGTIATYVAMILLGGCATAGTSVPLEETSAEGHREQAGIVGGVDLPGPLRRLPIEIPRGLLLPVQMRSPDTAAGSDTGAGADPRPITGATRSRASRKVM
jgi:hypothetical protein